MAVTRLERKGLRNKARAKTKQERIKKLTKLPPIKNVDVEKIKEEFAKKAGKPTAKKETKKKEEAPKAEKATETKADASEPQAEIKEPAKAPREDAEAVEKQIEEKEAEGEKE
ncbi:MAG: hypothetical protein RIG62_23130 [Cyclobacteriaceae bacterium]